MGQRASCRHCRRQSQANRSGLCRRCWEDPVLRGRYPLEPVPADLVALARRLRYLVLAAEQLREAVRMGWWEECRTLRDDLEQLLAASRPGQGK